MATLRQFRYYVRIVELGSMTRAAERLNVAQPALGLQMRQLEQEYGVALLQRHSRGVTPTSEGQLLYERATEILELVDRTGREIGTCRQDTTEIVRLGLSPSLMQLVASDLLTRARRDIPQLRLRLVEEMSFVLLDALQKGDLDMALAYDVPPQPGVHSTALLREELLFVTAPDLNTKTQSINEHGIVGTISAREALRADLTLPGTRDAIRQIVEKAAHDLSLTPHIIFEVQSVQAMKILAVDGIAAGILPYGTARPDLLSGQLIGRRIEAPTLERTLYLVRSDKFAELRSEVALQLLFETTKLRLADLLGPLFHEFVSLSDCSDRIRTAADANGEG
jgi:LysR family nitrogen assimilation transcriptional regulator